MAWLWESSAAMSNTLPGRVPLFGLRLGDRFSQLRARFFIESRECLRNRHTFRSIASGERLLFMRHAGDRRVSSRVKGRSIDTVDPAVVIDDAVKCVD